MKMTFIEPPSGGSKIPERLAGCSYELYHFPDLANFNIMATLLKAGIEVDYIDCIMTGCSENDFLDRLEGDSSDGYIIHSVLLSKQADLRTLKKIRGVKPSVPVFFHGPEPTRVAEEYVGDEHVFVFRGEAEYTLVDFLTRGTRTGMSCLHHAAVKHYEPSGELVDLDLLPMPPRDHVSLRPFMYNYTNPKFSHNPNTVMMTSRGCGFRCFFCVPISINFARELEYRRYFNKKPPVKMAGARRVIAEFCEIHRLGYKSVMIVDDQFLWAKERTLAICSGVKSLGLEWGCLSRADFLTDSDVLSALFESGCRSIDIGVESLNQKTLDFVRKDLKTETIAAAIENCNAFNIKVKINIMLGTCPQESRRDLLKTIRTVKKLPVSQAMFSLATPFKGTEFYNFCKEKNYLVDESENIDPLSKCMVSYPLLKNGELEQLQKYAYRSFYLRLGYVLRRIRSYRNLKDFIRDLLLASKLMR